MDHLRNDSSQHAGLTPDPGRRHFLRLAGMAGLSWLTPVGYLLARQTERRREHEPARSVILVWLAGGPSQLETFDPHPGAAIAGGTRGIATAVKGIQLAQGLEHLAEHMGSVSLIRSLVSKEGDHERGTYLMKTGYRPDATVVHPSIGSICCHHLPVGQVEIPRHVSILPGKWPSRGGFLGDQYDAFKTGDPARKVPDLTAQVAAQRDEQRLRDLAVVEEAFARGRRKQVQATLHMATIRKARRMMSSDQVKAFDVNAEPEKLRRAYGHTPFGRACLAARRLIEVGVRCVEVTLEGWDSHAANHSVHQDLLRILDPALASLLADLKERKLLDKTVVVCCGEFGRTPKINRLAGRDHWTNGFSLAIAGGGIRGGQVLGRTDPEGTRDPVNPVEVEAVHATVLAAVGLDPQRENLGPGGRPIKLSEGRPLKVLLQ
jgi:uncharacterized protein (DUF1501 family)